MKGFAAVIVRDLKLGLRQGGDMPTLVLFFFAVAVTMPFALGPDKARLAELAGAIVWIAALLAQLLSHERLFKSDFEDGTLEGLRAASLSLEAVVLAKLVAHWLLTGLPLIVATPLWG